MKIVTEDYLRTKMIGSSKPERRKFDTHLKLESGEKIFSLSYFDECHKEFICEKWYIFNKPDGTCELFKMHKTISQNIKSFKISDDEYLCTRPWCRGKGCKYCNNTGKLLWIDVILKRWTWT